MMIYSHSNSHYLWVVPVINVTDLNIFTLDFRSSVNQKYDHYGYVGSIQFL